MIIYTYSAAQEWGRNIKHKTIKNSCCFTRNVQISEVDIEIQFLRNTNKKNTRGRRNKEFDDCSLFMIAKHLMEFYFPRTKINKFIRLEDGIKNKDVYPYNFVVKMLPQEK